MNRFRLFVTSFSLFFLFSFNNANAQAEHLIGGEMDDASKWNTSVLNTLAGSEPTVSWNDTDNTPTAGSEGSLYIASNAPAEQSQYAIYQMVSLSSDSIYNFNGAFKYTDLNNAWCEAFIGTEPVDGEDYGEGQTKLVEFSFWNNPASTDGTFAVDGKNYKGFTPPTSGDYYFVFKAGCAAGGAITLAVDELTLTSDRTKPITDFSADVVSGFTPLEVQFTDMSGFASSWSWDFGDSSSLSTDQNPVHTYTEAGTYSVTLIATNEIGDSTLVKTDYIHVNPAEKLTAGGILIGGEMDDETKWNISFLSTAVEDQPTASWNDMVNTPSAGRDGTLFVTGFAPNNVTVQYAIYQKVTLSKDSVYDFNAAIKDFSTDLNNAWYEVFIGEEPIDGLDYTKDDNFLLAEFSTWSTECSPKGVDGTFLLAGCGNNSYTPPADGDYYFVLKMGSWSGGNFALAVDELSLTKSRVKPIVDFSADKPTGFVPLTIQFSDESDFGTSWEWNFGDESAVSTEQNPEHIYDNVGAYDVTLIVTNEVGSSTIVKTEYIKVNSKPDLLEGEMLYGGNMEDPNLWNITQLNASTTTTAVWNNTANSLTFGDGGNLLLSASVLNTTAQYCIWQSVDLKAGMRYTFNGAFKDMSTNLDHFWSEVFIGTTAPADGADYGEGQTKIAFFNTWDCGSSPGLDGTYQDNACGDEPAGVFVPEEDGTYYFVIKTGIIDWENTSYSFSIMIDEVTLMESENIPDPVADFFVDVTSGDAPLTVYFTDLSSNTSSWAWGFGDGNTSEEQHPNHTYTTGGVFTVSLTAYNEDMTSHTLVVDDLITVNGPTGIEDLDNFKLFIHPNPASDYLYISNISNLKHIEIHSITGQKIKSIEIHNKRIEIVDLPNGVYVISAESESGDVFTAKFFKN